MRTDTLPTCPTEELPDAKALLRLLSYAFAEANQLGLGDCAALIDRAAGEVQRRMEVEGAFGLSIDLTKLH